MYFKCHKFGNYLMKKTKGEPIDLPEKEKLPIPNIHLSKGKYPLYGRDPLMLFACILSGTLANCMQTCLNNKYSML